MTDDPRNSPQGTVRTAPLEVFEARRLATDGADLLTAAAAAPADWVERLLQAR